MRWTNISTEGLPQVYALAAGREWVVAGCRNGAFHILRVGSVHDPPPGCPHVGNGAALEPHYADTGTPHPGIEQGIEVSVPEFISGISTLLPSAETQPSAAALMPLSTRFACCSE